MGLLQLSDKLIDKAFGYWLSGLTDGEGCFGINIWKRKNLNYAGFTPYFQISQRADPPNQVALELIRNTLKVGVIYPSYCKGKLPLSRFVVRRIAENYEVIIPLFTTYPLRTKKRLEFELWSKAVKYLYDTRATNAYKMMHRSLDEREARYNYCLQIKQELEAVRQFRP